MLPEVLTALIVAPAVLWLLAEGIGLSANRSSAFRIGIPLRRRTEELELDVPRPRPEQLADRDFRRHDLEPTGERARAVWLDADTIGAWDASIRFGPRGRLYIPRLEALGVISSLLITIERAPNRTIFRHTIMLRVGPLLLFLLVSLQLRLWMPFTDAPPSFALGPIVFFGAFYLVLAVLSVRKMGPLYDELTAELARRRPLPRPEPPPATESGMLAG